MSELSFVAFVPSGELGAIHFGDLPSGAHSEPNLEGAARMIDILLLRMRFIEATAGGKRIIEP